MKIIKKGTPPSDKVYEGTCRSCKTVVEFKQSEGKVTHDQRDGNFVSVRCPVCNSLIHVSL